MLDTLPPAVRHAIFALIAALLMWLQDALPRLDTLPEILKAVIAMAITAALAFVTPLTRQYGVGAPPRAVDTGEGRLR